MAAPTGPLIYAVASPESNLITPAVIITYNPISTSRSGSRLAGARRAARGRFLSGSKEHPFARASRITRTGSETRPECVAGTLSFVLRALRDYGRAGTDWP